MKKKNIFFVALLSILSLMGCRDFLNQVPEGGTIMEDQKKAAIEANPGLLGADVAAMSANMIALHGVFGTRDAGGDFDFGYSAACLMMDCNGADMTCANIGYNWFAPNSSFADRVYTSLRTTYMWNLFYKQIASANIVLASVDPETENTILRAYRGQALAIRAFDYFQLAQLHQFTYKGHENEKCVPIIIETTLAEEANNNPRASVEDVYTRILDDLNQAVDLLAGFKRADKGYVDQSVAYGLRARVNLVMNNWAEAAADADSALVRSGAVPYTLAQLSAPVFYDATNDKTVLWANLITENNDIVQSGIINMPSHLCSFFTDGYIGVGAWKKISILLYNKISDDDIRKQWWLDANKESSIVKSSAFDGWREIASAEGDFGPYTNVKFGPYGGVEGMSKQIAAQDWFLMRAEEMILIKAEGLAMSGKTGDAKTLLENFINSNRMVRGKYTAPADAAGLQDAIWLQRRIELWGEGFSFYDIMRLKKPIVRVESGVTSFPDAWQFNIPAEAPILLWLVPKAEIEANKGISEDDNNAKVDPPLPGQ